MLSVAILLALAYGTQVEDAHERGIDPGILRTPPKTLSAQHRSSWQKPKRKVSVIRHGIDWLRRLLLKGRLWNWVWLLLEPKPNLKVTPMSLRDNTLRSSVSPPTFAGEKP